MEMGPIMPMAGGSAKLARWWPVLILLAVVPLLYPGIPPLTDLPGHMARIMVQMDGGRTADIARWYSFQWNLIPNLGTDLLAWLIEPVLGLEPAMKVIVILIVALQSVGYLLLARAAHGQVTATALFALPLTYGSPLQLGFLNFSLATALATLGLALWISPRMAVRPRLRYAIFSLIACAVWISHLAGWAMLCVMVGCCELAVRYERTQRFWTALAGGFAACSCLLLPQVLSLLWPAAPAHLPSYGFFRLAEKLYFLTSVLADRWTMFDVAAAFVLVVLILLTWWSRSFAMHKGLALSAIALFALLWLLPGKVIGARFADMRLVPTIFALAIIAVRPKFSGPPLKWLTIAGLVFFGVRLAGTTASMALWDRQFKQELAVLDSVPRGSQLISFDALPCRTFLLQDRVRDLHFPSFALTRRHAFANDQFAVTGGHLLAIHNPEAMPFDRDPSSIEIGEPCMGEIPVLASVARVSPAVPYLWIVWHTPELVVPGWQPVARSGVSVLYRRPSGRKAE
ncbi:hypothetical protein [Novosphingobium album (ex Hu et al. 2023)]|uniref:Glycosyltransferase RgtA/B/C/D-like domain-containing protein n=1 Tax=Novosphingobium album (ex Hu et al. 2023) TaxID=2930093 RepID=A0ABT0B3B6_9SPHN|nr:hypothetical protein [Novosphingobium album (ex Hu et al. 2023)]MCJ2179388.1 hypothetical protein [Novosphingobium album (ex Hu et al. 2023)]